MSSPIPAGSVNPVSTPEGPPSGATYLGRTRSVATDSTGQKFAVVDFALGRMRVPVSEDVNSGDILRLTYSSNGWRVEKQNEDPTAAAESATEFTLPGNLPALSRDLTQFENALIGFVTKAGNSNSNPDPTGANAATPEPATEQPAIQTLPSLIQQVLRQPGGVEFLSGQISLLPTDTLKTLIASLANASAPAGDDAQRGFLNLLQGVRRALAGPGNINDTEAAAPNSPGATGDPVISAEAAGAGKELPRYLGPESGSTLFTGRGVVLENRPAENLLPATGRPTPANTAGAAADPATAATGESSKLPSLNRYRLDVGGASLEAVSVEPRAPGDFVRFNLQRESGNLVMRFQNPESGWPPALQSALAAADPPHQSALRLAADYLQPDLNQPGFAQAAIGLANLLADAGRLQGAQASLPPQDEMDFLFRLLLAFPRDPASSQQAQIWSAVAKDPAAFADFLQQLRPGEDAALLARDLPLQPSSSPDAAAGNAGATAPGLQALAAALDHGSGLRLEDLLDALRGHSSDGDKLEGAEKFWLQAVNGAGARVDKSSDGTAQTFYFYQNAWHPAALQWSRVSDARQRARPLADSPPLQLRIQTQTPNLGAVEVNLSLDRRGSRLDFRNEHHDVRTLLSRALTPLERLLSDLDLRLAGWSYAPLPTTSATVADPDNTLPAVSGPVSQLDLFG